MLEIFWEWVIDFSTDPAYRRYFFAGILWHFSSPVSSVSTRTPKNLDHHIGLYSPASRILWNRHWSRLACCSFPSQVRHRIAWVQLSDVTCVPYGTVWQHNREEWKLQDIPSPGPIQWKKNPGTADPDFELTQTPLLFSIFRPKNFLDDHFFACPISLDRPIVPLKVNQNMCFMKPGCCWIHACQF
jgi:hypothetical protein